MSAIFYLLYLALGAAQIAAYLAGIHLWLGVGTFFGLIIFFGTAALPFPGAIFDAAISFYGAYKGWNWPWWQAALLTFPFAIIGVSVVAADTAADLISRLRKRSVGCRGAMEPAESRFGEGLSGRASRS
jgi:hypothetical protein